MKPRRRQASIGTLMAAIAVVACVLAAPRIARFSVKPPKLDPVALVLLGLAGFVLGMAGGTAASRAGIVPRADRGLSPSKPRDPEGRPCPPP